MSKEDAPNFRYHLYGSCALCKFALWDPLSEGKHSCEKHNFNLPRGFWNYLCDSFETAERKIYIR